MRLQRGIISTDLIIAGAAAIAVAAAVAGGVLYVQHVRAAAFEDGDAAGARRTLLQVAQRDNEQLVAAEAEILQLNREKDALERISAARMATIDQEGQDALKALEGQHGRFLDDLFAGRVRLPGQGRADPGGPEGGGGPAAAVAGAAGVGDGAADAELRATAGRFFGGEAQRADQVVVQLTACQAIVLADREACSPAGGDRAGACSTTLKEKDDGEESGPAARERADLKGGRRGQ